MREWVLAEDSEPSWRWGIATLGTGGEGQCSDFLMVVVGWLEACLVAVVDVGQVPRRRLVAAEAKGS